MNILPSIPGSCFREISTGKFNPHIETAQKEQLISTKGSPTRQLIKNYILHYINRLDYGLPFDECGLVGTAQSNILPSIPESCCQEKINFPQEIYFAC